MLPAHIRSCSMDMPVNVPVDNPDADTEWSVTRFSLPLSLTRHRNDILRERGIIPPKPPSPTPIIQEALREAQKEAHENRLENKDLDELDELEDEEDESFLDKYRCVHPSRRHFGAGFD